MIDNLICECGKVFESVRSLNGHKSHCKKHLELTGRLNIREAVDRENGSKISKTLKEHHAKLKTKTIQDWILQNHTCEKCGKVMVEKYASGRFCSRTCANSRNHSEDTISKIRNTSRATRNFKLEYELDQHSLNLHKYEENPNKCLICHIPLPWDRRFRKTCSDECYQKLASDNSRKAAITKGGNINIKGTRGSAKYGTYKGFHCDSSFELALVIYCLDKNINIERNSKGFDYIFEGQLCKYYPDFKINDTYIETKNYWTPRVQAKIDQFPKDLKYVILYGKDLKPCINHCISTYGEAYTELYDREQPSWMDKR